MPIICEYCKKPITGQYITTNNKTYHLDCYNNYVAIKCSICKEPINGHYFQDDWGNNVCDKHTIKYCDSCNRLITTTLPKPVNGRVYCSLCQAVTVNNAAQIPSVYNNILSIYKKYTINNVPERVPIHLVDNNTLAQKAQSIQTPDLLGLAVTNTTWFGNSTQKSFDHHIYILGGMPLVEFESVLAHELLHTWLNQYEIKMPAPETEGFCNLGSYLVLSLNGTKHAQILMKRIKEDKSEVYGAGFRKMLVEVQKKGWVIFLKETKNNG